MQIKIKKVHPDAVIPKFATNGAACFDLHAVDCGDGAPIFAGSALTIRTGLAFEIPPGNVMLIFSRSGHGFNNDVSLSNAVGVIDSDYRGEVHVKLRNDSGLGAVFRAHPGDRIAQALILPLPHIQLVESMDLSDTERGAGGFGSTGS